METDILTIKEVAEYLRIMEKTAYRLASERKIPAFKVGGSWRFRKGEIEVDESYFGGVKKGKVPGLRTTQARRPGLCRHHPERPLGSASAHPGEQDTARQHRLPRHGRSAAVSVARRASVADAAAGYLSADDDGAALFLPLARHGTMAVDQPCAVDDGARQDRHMDPRDRQAIRPRRGLRSAAATLGRRAHHPERHRMALHGLRSTPQAPYSKTLISNPIIMSQTLKVFDIVNCI